MRITTNILINNFLINYWNNLEKLNELQNQLSTGKRIIRASDDPLGANRALYLRTILRERTQFTNNLNELHSHLSIASDTLNDLKYVLDNAKQIAIQGANEPSHIALEALATQVQKIIEQALQLANKAYDGKYIFAGDKVDVKPYTDNLQYVGDNSKRYIDIGYGIKIAANLTGYETFGSREHKLVAAVGVENINAALRLGIDTTQSTVLTGANSLPAGTSETTILSALGVVSGSITINNGVADYTINVDPAETLGNLLDEISTIPGMNAYYRIADGRVILLNSNGQPITIVADTSGFDAIAGLTAGIQTTTKAGTFIIDVNELESVPIDFIDVDYDSLNKLKDAINARVNLIGANQLAGGTNRQTVLSTLGVTSGTLTITTDYGTYTINVDNTSTLDRLLNQIDAVAPQISAYYRLSDRRIILTSSVATTTFNVGGTSNFASIAGIDAASLPILQTTSPQVTAQIDDTGRLIITSNIDRTEGKIKIIDGVRDGLMTKLQLAYDNGIIAGYEFDPNEELFDRLTVLKAALNSVAFAEDYLDNLTYKETPLSLRAGDIITVSANTGFGMQSINFTVGSEVKTLQDLALRIQNFLRTHPQLAAQTVIVRINNGTLEIINPAGATAQNIITISVTAVAVDGTPRTVFNEVMQPLSGIPADGSRTTSYQMKTTSPQNNVGNRIEEINTLIDNLLKNQAILGWGVRRVELTKNRLEDEKVDFTKLLSETEDIDMAKAMLEFQRQQLIYQSALAVAARILQPSLIYFLS